MFADIAAGARALAGLSRLVGGDRRIKGGSAVAGKYCENYQAIKLSEDVNKAKHSAKRCWACERRENVDYMRRISE